MKLISLWIIKRPRSIKVLPKPLGTLRKWCSSPGFRRIPIVQGSVEASIVHQDFGKKNTQIQGESTQDKWVSWSTCNCSMTFWTMSVPMKPPNAIYLHYPCRLARLWFNGLSVGSIESWTNFCERFSTYYTSCKRQMLIVVSLRGIVQVKKESLQSYIDCFTQVSVEVNGAK